MARDRSGSLIPLLRDHRTAILGGIWRLLVLVLLVAVVLQVVAPVTYRLEQGYVTFRLNPIRPYESGRVIMPLGPVGVLQFETHRTPVDLEVDFRLGDQLPTVAQAKDIVTGDAVERDAVDAFDRFALSRVPWILVAGLLAGLLVVGGSGRSPRRGVRAAGAGMLVAATALCLFVGATLLTLDRSPTVDYQGLAAQAPRVLELVGRFERDSATGSSSVKDLVRGLEEVAQQLEQADQSAERAVTRVLVVADVHDNLIGLLLASSLAASEAAPVDAVVLAGDITQRGTETEADLAVSRLKAGNTPVVVVGGNHEDRPAMERFRAAGYIVLAEGATTIAGLSVYGLSDPQAFAFEATPDEDALDRQASALLTEWQAMSVRPEVLIVHDPSQADAVTRWAQDHNERLSVIHAHTHEPSVTERGTVTVVDPGTGGASGYESVGRDPEAMYTFQLLEFSREEPTRLLAVVTMSYSGLTGPSSVSYEPVGR